MRDVTWIVCCTSTLDVDVYNIQICLDLCELYWYTSAYLPTPSAARGRKCLATFQWAEGHRADVGPCVLCPWVLQCSIVLVFLYCLARLGEAMKNTHSRRRRQPSSTFEGFPVSQWVPSAQNALTVRGANCGRSQPQGLSRTGPKVMF